MRWRLSKHAQEELARRGIPLAVVAEVIAKPEQIVHERNALRAHQSRIIWHDGRVFLVRILVDDSIDAMVIVTIYRTSKVDKYWSEDEDLL